MSALTEQNAATVASLLSEAKAASKAVRVTSKFIADTMEEIHGCKFRVVIGHEPAFVLIRQV